MKTRSAMEGADPSSRYEINKMSASSRLKGKAPAPSSAPIWVQTAHARVVADRLGLVKRPRAADVVE
jgi:hypothetical protein